MKFKTELNPQWSLRAISHQDELVFVGSCFAEEMASKFNRYRFKQELNAHGILFHPLAISRALKQILENRPVNEDSVVFDQGMWHSFDYHGRFSSSEKSMLFAKANAEIDSFHKALKRASKLVITWGTAHGYVHEKYQQVVSNCHKIPQSQFEKVLTSHLEIEEEYMPLFADLKTFNPNLEVVITVSPVKYLKDGFTGNALSKSHLLIAANELNNHYDWVTYFPAYELVSDDLRDYRFYKSDMVHPNDMAIEYVWQKLSECCFSETTKVAIKSMEPLLRQLEHRPLHHQIDELEVQKIKEAIDHIVASSK